MLSVTEILDPIQLEMSEFEVRFQKSMQSKVPLLDKITHYIVKRKGKQMRPMFVFLTSKMLGEITDKTFDAASLVELLHTATLVHDDVVDDSNERRGFFSVNALWKNKIAVLIGDFLLSRGLLLSLDNISLILYSLTASCSSSYRKFTKSCKKTGLKFVSDCTSINSPLSDHHLDPLS